MCGIASLSAAVGARGTIFCARISMTPCRAVPVLQILPCAPTAACLWLVSIHLLSWKSLTWASTQSRQVMLVILHAVSDQLELRHHHFSTLLHQAAWYCSLHATASNLAAAASVLL